MSGWYRLLARCIGYDIGERADLQSRHGYFFAHHWFHTDVQESHGGLLKTIEQCQVHFRDLCSTFLGVTAFQFTEAFQR